MRLHSQLVLSQARLFKIKVELSSEDPKVTLCVRTALTTEVAEAFGCRELIYAGDVPRSGASKIELEGEEVDAEFHLKNDNFAFGATADSIGKYVAKWKDGGLRLEFDLKFTGYAEILADILIRVKIDPLEVTLKPAQASLDLQKEKQDGPCVDCNNEVPFSDPEKTLHMSGQPCLAQSAAHAPEAAGEAPLAQAAVMSGTHQRGRGRPRKADAPATAPAEASEETGDFMKDITEVVH